MAKPFSLELNKFKKTSEDKHCATLQHPDGHEFKIAKSSLSPKMREQLALIPLHKAEGGEVEQESQEPDGAKKFVKGFKKATHDKEEQPKPKHKEPEKMADGGEVPVVQEAPKQEEAKAPEVIDNTPPPIDEGLHRKRELYNQISGVSQGPMGVNTFGPGVTFGKEGQAPQSFNPKTWQEAELAYSKEQADNAAKAADTQHQVIEANKSRVAAGMQPLPVPNVPQGQLPPGMPVEPKEAAKTLAAATEQPRPDTFGTEAYYQNYEKGISEQKAGIQKAAEAEAQMGQAQGQALQQQVENQQIMAKNYQDHYDELDMERKAFQKDVQDSHIDPNHYMNSMDTGSRVATAIGLVLGGMSSGLTGQDNPALKMLNQQIDRDIAAQKDNLGKKESLLNANMRQFGNMKDATDMTRVMSMDIVSNQLKKAAADAAEPGAKARALQAAGQLDQQAAPILAQIAMRKSLLGGMQSGRADPSQVIRMIVPEGQQAHAYKELQEAQNMAKARDNILGAFEKLAQINTVANRVGSPIQTAKQVDAIKQPLVAGLSKETAGRFTEADSKMIDGLFPATGDSDETQAIKKNQLNKLISEKMNFPILQSYGINMGHSGRFDPSGAKKIQLGPPVPSK